MPGRHGQGWHNLCATKVTAYEWEMDWCKRNGDGVHVWGPDAELTELGQNQALVSVLRILTCPLIRPY
jgi:hypothetical protein